PLFVEPKRSKRGWVRKLSLDLSDFTLNGLRVERLAATIPDCNFDMSLAAREKRIRVSKSGTGSGEVVVLAADLERFVLKKFREIKT
ncbi:hypothetical protein C1X37_33915, partial [Pseudomonas sp. FW305-3-2-15-A-R2A1]|uniref:hypothetical protein n=1 Tax=Pseudomonas sp. FW305-3-2-15-A-R2A1 TaxID=2070607 RepID=UPI000CAC7F9E